MRLTKVVSLINLGVGQAALINTRRPPRAHGLAPPVWLLWAVLGALRVWGLTPRQPGLQAQHSATVPSSRHRWDPSSQRPPRPHALGAPEGQELRLWEMGSKHSERLGRSSEWWKVVSTSSEASSPPQAQSQQPHWRRQKQRHLLPTMSRLPQHRRPPPALAAVHGVPERG